MPSAISIQRMFWKREVKHFLPVDLSNGMRYFINEKWNARNELQADMISGTNRKRKAEKERSALERPHPDKSVIFV